MTNNSRGMDRASVFWLLLSAAVLLAWLVILGAFGVLDAFRWMAHPIAGVLLGLYASVVFVPKQWRFPLPIILATGGLLAMSFLGAPWVVHPLAGITIGLLASSAFTGRTRDLPRVVFAVSLLALLSLLGASWAIFPLVILSVIALGIAPFTIAGAKRRAARRAAKKNGTLDAPTVTAALPAPDDSNALHIPMPRLEEQHVPAGKTQARQRPTAPAPAPHAAKDDLTAELTMLLSQEAARLPGPARDRLSRLRDDVRDGLTYLKEHDRQNEDSDRLLNSIAGDYAPTAVRAYLRLPASLATVTPLHDGKTGAELLVEQLDLLLSATRDVMTDVTRNGGQELLAHRRFLEDKFGRKADKDFDI